MTRNFPRFIPKLIGLLRHQVPRLESAELLGYVSRFLDQRETYLKAVQTDGSPLYLLDKTILVERARQFLGAFQQYLPSVRVFFAMKSNNCPDVARTLIGEGLGLDVSSGRELAAAVEYGASSILFSGPGKCDAELDLAARHGDRVTVLLDSFGELRRLEARCGERQCRMSAGVRLTTDNTGIWRKFGIPLSELQRFMVQAGRCRYVQLEGLQFHLSWNLDPRNYTTFIKHLGATLRALDPKYRASLRFLDIGGGFWPPQGEWLQPAATPRGILLNALQKHAAESLHHFKCPAASIEEFAGRIGRALQTYIPDDMTYDVYAEPGRWLCNDAMQIVLTVADRKAPDVVITDGGTNAVGWERFESDYFPVINLTRPGLTERECLIAGSLCTPHDIWGYAYFGEDIQPGDVLLIPDQGAYTYSLRQEFIKPLPKTAILAISDPGSGKVLSSSADV